MPFFKIFTIWHVLPIFILLLFFSPILIILFSLFSGYSENWEHIYNYVLTDYIVNSLILVSGVSILVIIIGSVTAWIVTNYHFTGRRFFEWGLILPLAIPPYILAAETPLSYQGINGTGLKRRGFSPVDRKMIKEIYKEYFHSKRNRNESILKIKEKFPDSPFKKQILYFIDTSKRGII